MHTILIPSAIPPNNILISTQELIINTYDYFNKDISMRHEPVAVIKNKPAFDNFCDLLMSFFLEEKCSIS